MTTRSLAEPREAAPPKAPRDPAVARAEAEVEAARERVAESMMALRQEVARRADWRGWVVRRPAVVLGAAFLLGLFLGTRGRSRRS